MDTTAETSLTCHELSNSISQACDTGNSPACSCFETDSHSPLSISLPASPPSPVKVVSGPKLPKPEVMGSGSRSRWKSRRSKTTRRSPNPKCERKSDITIDSSKPFKLSNLSTPELEKSFRALSCHHLKLQEKHVALMKAHLERENEITRLTAQIRALENELYLTQLAHSDEAFDPLRTSLNQYDIRPTGDTPSREAHTTLPW
ncbi:uncharacterized protein BO97DRAFT_51027 [Aspergillus homomorphus CBS 101889]|uniref:Uncharacterized protein n=1 Tax=Aspergillus homomorphus (strain CBS 101889) TaxID=1450537 RepID=A0A395HYH6_ASPHC|nr:hypothetical protein BO97DRAFT_51027 [Aspergillus homomorphus CBS 101889]RAL12586.1 hypothetical protein BO97DRAFT_51027 [Aspergillus homomorphus CBS 101889]